ncbi:hypothetical protein QJS10_CPB18g00570 [Acorus calamus]|uniref:Uncharacterized protein n=1 Tax=Acorus calamus TaxID=4465 RepID=A0AAV9CNF3_ACOCL|nr:hypothetical protein QJS10_CPB18g00570 [Acorus calamus]
MQVICEPLIPSGPKPFKYFEMWESTLPSKPLLKQPGEHRSSATLYIGCLGVQTDVLVSTTKTSPPFEGPGFKS